MKVLPTGIRTKITVGPNNVRVVEVQTKDEHAQMMHNNVVDNIPNLYNDVPL